MHLFKRRTFSFIALTSLVLFSFWLFLQNISLSNKTSRDQITQTLSSQNNARFLPKLSDFPKRVKISLADFKPPPADENEERSVGYTLEDAYFRRWQVAHGVNPVRPVRKPASQKGHHRGWADMAAMDVNSPRIKAHIERMRERQKQMAMLREKHISAYRNRTGERARRSGDQRIIEDDLEDQKESSPDGEPQVKELRLGRPEKKTVRPYLSHVKMGSLQQRLTEYCNANGVAHSEGLGPPGYSLQEVYVIARHGDRTPMEDISDELNQSEKVKWECNLKRWSKVADSLILKRFVAFIEEEHENMQDYDEWLRNALQKIPTGANSMTCGNAQLTPQGWLQHLTLGEHMRARYALKLGLDLNALQRPDCCSFHSTTHTRTLQSTTAFMFGFLPVFDLSDIKRIETNGHVNFCQNAQCQCDTRDYLYEKTAKTMSALARSSKNISKTVVDVMFNSSRHPYVFPAKLVEQLSGRYCHGKPLPCNKKGCVTEKLLSDLFQQVDNMAVKARADNTLFEKYGRLFMYPLLLEVASRMEERITRSSSLPKFNLFMGHDITLIPLKDALGIKDSSWPGFASNIIFELWKNPTSLYIVRILYNGRDITKETQFCDNSHTASRNCPFDRFLHYVSHELLSVFNVSSFQDACSLQGR